MDDMKITLDQAATFVADATMDGCIDGTLNGGTGKIDMRMAGQGELAQGEMKFKLTFKISGSAEETEKELAGK
jgi:hypothetical protein